MKTILVAYLGAGLAFLAIDAVWLGTMAGLVYRPLLGHLLAEEFNFAPAALFYLIYIGGIVFFAVRPALRDRRLGTAALNGAVLGFVAYSTYDLTNHATLPDWPAIVSAMDMVWGTVLTATASMAGFLAARRFAR